LFRYHSSGAVHALKNKILSLCSRSDILKSKKFKDFKDWSILIDIYYLGYHLLPEGKLLINEIKKGWNNFRLPSNDTAAEQIRNKNNY